MVGVLVHCDTCGFTGPAAGLIDLPGGSTLQVTFSRSQFTCPACGALADILDGTFEYRDDVITVLSAPHWTRARLLELQRALRDAQQLLLKDSGAAIARVAEVDQRTAGLLLRQVLASKELMGVMAVLTVLLAAVGILVTLYSGRDALKPEDVQRIVDQQIQQLEREREPVAPPTPSPPPAPSSESPAEPGPPA